MDEIRLDVVKFSESFSQIWEPLAADIGSTGCSFLDKNSQELHREAAALVLAAGGVEKETLDWLDSHKTPPNVPVFVVGSDSARRTATQIVGRGATDYFALPEDLEILRNALESAVRRRRVELRRTRPKRSAKRGRQFTSITGESPAIKAVLDRAAKILSHPDTTILLTGETGTGKELLARGIHDSGPRRAHPFVAINCSALPENLIESELFGHERGAFTGAHAAKLGLFEAADGGTLFLDEIGTVPLALQPKLLRILDDKQVRRVGGTKVRKIDVRIIAATNEDLRESVAQGSFREDLFYRLSVITLNLPPLREREEDVLVIAAEALERIAKQNGLPVPKLTNEVRQALLKYHWPGNVRELKNAVERALLLSPPGELDPEELLRSSATTTAKEAVIPFPAELDRINVAAVKATVALCAGNRSEAARRLAISRRRLRRLLDEGAVTSTGGG